MSNFIHLHKNRLETNYSFLLFLIPPLVFLITLFLLLKIQAFQDFSMANSNNETQILGEESP